MLVHRGFPSELERYRRLITDHGGTICVPEGRVHFVDGVDYKWRRGMEIAHGRRILAVGTARVICEGQMRVSAAMSAHVTARQASVTLTEEAALVAMMGTEADLKGFGPVELRDNAKADLYGANTVHLYDSAEIHIREGSTGEVIRHSSRAIVIDHRKQEAALDTTGYQAAF